MEERGMSGGPLLLLWAPSKLLRELRSFCMPELHEQYRIAALQRHRRGAAAAGAAQHVVPAGLPPPPHLPPPLALRPAGDGYVADISTRQQQQRQVDLPLLLTAARQCMLLTAVIQPLAAAATLEGAAAAAAAAATLQGAAAAAAAGNLQGAGAETPAAAVTQQAAGAAAAFQQHPLKVLSLRASSARAPAERHLRQQLQGLGFGSSPAPGQPPVWCIQQEQQRVGPQKQQAGQQAGQQQQRQEELLLGLELASGASLPPAAMAAARKLGPTAMLPELAAVSASLATVQPGSTVLDPFCGTGSMLAAALLRGAALAVGSDIDDTHFSRGDGKGSSSSSGATIFVQADAAALQQLLPGGSVDAIVTDLPYGYRTTAAVAGPPSSSSSSGGGPAGGVAVAAAGAPPAEEAAEDWQQLLGVLLRLARHVLAPGGRLLTWLPCQPGGSGSSGNHISGSGSSIAAGSPPCSDPLEQQCQQLAGWGKQQQLCLLYLLPETRQAGYPRAVAVFERQGSSHGSSSSSSASSSSRQQHLIAALRAAAGKVPVFNLPSQQQQQEQQQEQHAQCPESLPRPPAADRHLEPTGEQAVTLGSTAASAAAAVQQRGVKYKHVRKAAVGTAIDVWRAAWLGDTAAIGEYAAAGGDINARDGKGQTPLQFAAGYGKEAAVALLLQLGSDPAAAADRSGMPPLHRAAARNHTGVMHRLLLAGADCWQRSAAGQTALMYACQFGHEAAVGLLLEHVLAVDQQQQQQRQQLEQGANCYGNITFTETATLPRTAPDVGSDAVGSCPSGAGSSGASGKASSSLQQHLALCDASGLTALHVAAQWGMAAAAELLLAAGADANQLSRCDRQLAPAHLAARWGHSAVMPVLQRHGGDLRQRCGGRGWTPLQEAEEWRRTACMQLLLVAAAGVQQQD